MTLFLVRSPFILSPTAMIALSRSESGLVSPSFLFRKFVRTRAISSLSEKETNDESFFRRAIPQYRTIPAIAFASASGTYFLTSAAQLKLDRKAASNAPYLSSSAAGLRSEIEVSEQRAAEQQEGGDAAPTDCQS